MNKNTLYLLLCLVSCAEIPAEPGDGWESDVLSWVAPLIGTGGHGHTYPGATTPFGMIQLSPSTDVKGWDWYGGYHYSDTVLKGFAHTHTSGTGLAGLGDILLMPMAGEGTVLAGTDADPDSGFRSRFHHEREKASPGYYAVHLEDYDIDAELTATTRTGFHRYTFNRAGEGHVVIDPTHVIGIGKHEYITLSDYLLDTELEILSDTEVSGFKHTNGSAGNRRVYFYARFSKPFQKGRIAVDDKFTDDKKAAGYNTKALLSFDMEAGEKLVVKVGLSFVSREGARKNFEAEAAEKSFDEVLAAAEATWRAHLSKISVKGGTDRQRRIFYTALYHALLGPVIINDVDGRYYVEGKVYQDTANQYSSFSTWDTFRAQHPLLVLLEPERVREIVHSLISRHTMAGVDIPIWELCGFDNMVMTGYTPVSVIYDAIVKGIPGIDEEAAYAAMKSVAMNEEKGSVFAKGSIVKQIKEHGFVTAELVQSATHTMEYAYQDWCIAQMAERLGKGEDTGYFRERAESYKHIFRPETGYMWPRLPDGGWVEFDTTNWEEMQAHYITGNIWGYSTFLLHDVPYLLETRGGKAGLAGWLDRILMDTTTMAGAAHMDISGFIGKYGHGDEPSHHIPFLYNYAGQPWKTQALVRQVLETMYGDTPDGLVNNEDYGQMSAWYIFGAMGFYPFCPGEAEYTTCSPLFDEISLRLDDGNAFTIRAKNNSGKNRYIGGASLNGRPWDSHLLPHEAIVSGGELVFTIQPEPNRSWGTKERQ